MDLSKLPGSPRKDERSESAPARPDDVDEGISYAPAPRREPVGADAWISVVIGIIVLMLQPRFLSWLASILFDRAFTWTFRDESRQPITYQQSIYFIHDLGLTLFGAALVLDGLVLLSRRRGLILLGLLLIAVATLMNLISVIYLYAFTTAGFQLMPALAVAIGGYLVAIRLPRVRQGQ